MKVCVVAEYYPRRRDPVLGVWAHRQAVAARDAGADVRVLALERPVPPLGALRHPARLIPELRGIASQPRRELSSRNTASRPTPSRATRRPIGTIRSTESWVGLTLIVPPRLAPP